MKQVHDASQLHESGPQARQVKQHHPWEEQTCEDRRLENHP